MTTMHRPQPLERMGRADQVDLEQRKAAMDADLGWWDAQVRAGSAVYHSGPTGFLTRVYQDPSYPADPNWKLTPKELDAATLGIDPDLWPNLASARSADHLTYLSLVAKDITERRQELAATASKGWAGSLVGGLIDPAMIAAGLVTGGAANAIGTAGRVGAIGRIALSAAAGGLPPAALMAAQSTEDPSITGTSITKAALGGAGFGAAAGFSGGFGWKGRAVLGGLGQALPPLGVDVIAGTPAGETMTEFAHNWMFGGLFNAIPHGGKPSTVDTPTNRNYEAPRLPPDPNIGAEWEGMIRDLKNRMLSESLGLDPAAQQRVEDAVASSKIMRGAIPEPVNAPPSAVKPGPAVGSAAVAAAADRIRTGLRTAAFAPSKLKASLHDIVGSLLDVQGQNPTALAAVVAQIETPALFEGMTKAQRAEVRSILDAVQAEAERRIARTSDANRAPTPSPLAAMRNAARGEPTGVPIETIPAETARAAVSAEKARQAAIAELNARPPTPAPKFDPPEEPGPGVPRPVPRPPGQPGGAEVFPYSGDATLRDQRPGPTPSPLARMGRSYAAPTPPPDGFYRPAQQVADAMIADLKAAREAAGRDQAEAEANAERFAQRFAEADLRMRPVIAQILSGEPTMPPKLIDRLDAYARIGLRVAQAQAEFPGTAENKRRIRPLFKTTGKANPADQTQPTPPPFDLMSTGAAAPTPTPMRELAAETIDRLGRNFTGDRAVDAARQEGRPLSPEEAARYPNSTDPARVAERVQVALEAPGASTPMPDVQVVHEPIPQPETGQRTMKLTRNGMWERLVSLWREDPVHADAANWADMVIAGGTEHDTGLRNNPFIYSEQSIGEVEALFGGTPLRSRFRLAEGTQGSSAAGFEEALHVLGDKRFVELVNAFYGKRGESFQPWARTEAAKWANSDAPTVPGEARFLAQVLDGLSKSETKLFDRRVAFADPKDIQLGVEFKIADRRFRVIENEDGVRVIADGEGWREVPINEMQSLPYDRGSLRLMTEDELFSLANVDFAAVPPEKPLSNAETVLLMELMDRFDVPPAEARKALAESGIQNTLPHPEGETVTPRASTVDGEKIPTPPAGATPSPLGKLADSLNAWAEKQRNVKLPRGKNGRSGGTVLGNQFAALAADAAAAVLRAGETTWQGVVQTVHTLAKTLGLELGDNEGPVLQHTAHVLEKMGHKVEGVPAFGEVDAAEPPMLKPDRAFNLDEFNGKSMEVGASRTKVFGIPFRFDIAGSLGKSRSSLMRLMGRVVATDMTPGLDGKSYASLEEKVAREVHSYEFRYNQEVVGLWHEMKRDAEANGRVAMKMDDFLISLGKSQRRPGEVPNPFMEKARLSRRKLSDELRQFLIDHGVKVGQVPDYLTRLWNRTAMDDAMALMGRSGNPDPLTDHERGRPVLTQRISEAILAKGEIVDPEEALKLASDIVKHGGLRDGYGGDDAVTSGFTNRLKDRIPLDETYTWTNPDGTVMGIEDLIESNDYALFKSYSRGMIGSAALAEVGRMVSSNPDLSVDRVNGVRQILSRLAEDAASVGHTPDEVRKQVEEARVVLHGIAGLPAYKETKVGRATDAFRRVLGAKLMSGFGPTMTQIGESIGQMGHHGAAVLETFTPALRDVVELARGGKISKQGAQAMVEFGVGLDRIASQIPSPLGDDTGHPVNQSRGEYVLRKVERAAYDIGGLSFATDASRLQAAVLETRKWYEMAKAGKIVTGADGIQRWEGTLPNDRRLAIDTLSPEMAKRMMLQLALEGRVVLGEKGVIDHINYGAWTDTGARAAFRDAITRAAHRAIPNPTASALPLAVNNPLGKLLTQLRKLQIMPQVTTAPELYAKDDTTVRWLAARSVGAVLSYVGFTLLTAMFRQDRREYLDERLQWDKVAKAGFSRSLYSSYIPLAVDTLWSDIGRQSPVFSYARTAGPQGGVLFGVPAVDFLKQAGFPGDPLRIPRALAAPIIPGYDFSQDDLRTLQRTILPNITGLSATIDRIRDDLPPTSFDEP